MIYLLKTHKVNLSLIVVLLSFIVFSISLQQAYATQTALASWVADDPDDLNTTFDAGDTLTITFAGATNATVGPIVSQAAIAGNYTFAGTILDGTVTGLWTDATNFQITIVTAGTAPVLTTTVVTATVGNTIGILGEPPGADITHTLNPATTTSALSGDFGLFVAVVLGGGGSGCTGDCFAPTLGVDNEGNRLVTDGFTYNGNPINVELFFTPYPLITVDVGKKNTAEFKIYENYGPDNIRHFELAFGLGTGQFVSASKAVIVWDKTFDGIETVTVEDPDNVLQDVSVRTSTGKCADDSASECLLVTIDHTFRAPLDFNIVGTNVWDTKRNSFQNYYNHGVEIQGKSLNPPNEYFGIYKGNLIHLIETAKNTAIDADGNTWTFDNIWIKDYIYKGKIDDPITSQGYDRDHVKFNAIMQEQELVASSLFEKYYKTSVSQEPEFEEIDDIYPTYVSQGFDRDHPDFAAYQQEQVQIALSFLKEHFPEYASESFEEINNIYSYEYSEQNEQDSVIKKHNINEEIKKAQQTIQEYYKSSY